MCPGTAALWPQLLLGCAPHPHSGRTWLSWVPSPWAWVGSGQARRAHSSWM